MRVRILLFGIAVGCGFIEVGYSNLMTLLQLKRRVGHMPPGAMTRLAASYCFGYALSRKTKSHVVMGSCQIFERDAAHRPAHVWGRAL